MSTSIKKLPLLILVILIAVLGIQLTALPQTATETMELPSIKPEGIMYSYFNAFKNLRFEAALDLTEGPQRKIVQSLVDSIKANGNTVPEDYKGITNQLSSMIIEDILYTDDNEWSKVYCSWVRKTYDKDTKECISVYKRYMYLLHNIDSKTWKISYEHFLGEYRFFCDYEKKIREENK